MHRERERATYAYMEKYPPRHTTCVVLHSCRPGAATALSEAVQATVTTLAAAAAPTVLVFCTVRPDPPFPIAKHDAHPRERERKGLCVCLWVCGPGPR
jgi:hypothetical protein